MLETKESLSKLAGEVQIFPQVLKNVKVVDKQKAGENKAVLAAVENVSRTLGDDGRILLRPSGTEPLIRVMVEAKTMEECEKYTDKVIKVMQDEGLLI